MRTRYKVLIGAIVLILAAFIAIFLNTPETVLVPDVKGQTVEAASANIESAGLVVGTITEEASSEVEEGTVLRTDPAANTSKREGSKVNIIVAMKEVVQVPNVVGKELATAKAELEAAGFTIGTVTEENSDEQAAGLVISTNPAANSSKAKGSTINIVVSKGAETLAVPDVRGKKLETAKAELEAAGFKIGEVTETYSDTVASGLVILTDPANGVETSKNTTINIQVSKGAAILMPDFGYMQVSYAEARRQLQALGVSVSTIERVEDSAHVSSTGDLVVSQYPEAGSTIEGTVTLYVSVAGTSSSSSNNTQTTTVNSGQ